MMHPSERTQPTENMSCLVLLVDDQPMVGQAVLRLLAGQQDIDMHYCPNPEDAISVANEIRPTVILQDLVMPNISGLDLVGYFRANPASTDTPIIVLSTEEEPETKRLAFAAGANDYLIKLPDKIELIARIRYHSKAHLHRIQRDEAFRALRESQQKLLESNTNLVALNKKLEEATRALEVQATQDSLTGIWNRGAILNHLDAELSRARRKNEPVAVLMADLDYFKCLNDRFGHPAGDTALAEAARRMKCCIRQYDGIGRYGGEEFMVVLSQADASLAASMAERLRRSLEIDSISTAAGNVTVTCSIGVAIADSRKPAHASELLREADAALYRAKALGRNRVAMASEESHNTLVANIRP